LDGTEMTKKQLKNILLGFLLQFPLIVALQNGVSFLTGLSILWCVPISVVLIVMYDSGGSIMRDEKMTKPKYIFRKVVCDETNNTQEDIENQVVNVDIYGEIISPIEKIIVDIALNKND
jgi:hypothetical protein